MKKIIVRGIIILIAASVLLRGLYFNYETYALLTVLSVLSFLYYLIKKINNEAVYMNKWYTFLGMLLVIANILGFINAVNPRENLGSTLMYIELVIVFHVLFDYFYDSKQQFIKEIMFSTVIVGFFCAVVGLEALTGSFSFLDITLFNNRLGSTFQYTNTASIYFALCIVFSLTLANTANSRINKALFAGAGNIFIFAFFMTGSRGGYLVGMVSIMLFIILQPSGFKMNGIVYFISMLIPLFITVNGFNTSTSNNDYLRSTAWLVISFISAAALSLCFYSISSMVKRFVLKKNSITLPRSSRAIFVAVFAVTIIFVFVFREMFISLLPVVLGDRLQKLSFNDPTILFRLEFDKDAMKLIACNWLFGLGGGGWKATYQSVQDVFYISSFVHNNYLQIFVESGVVGFISYIALAFITFLYAFISYIKAIDKMLKVYSAGLFCGFLALTIHSSFDFDLSFGSMALLFWVMFAASSVREGILDKVSDSEAGKPLLIEKQNIVSYKYIYKIIPIILCAVLFSMYTKFFIGAYNGHEGLKHMETNSYELSMFYYEEANRLDPQNTDYLFELSKLYNYFAKISKNNEEKDIWLEKSKMAGEKSVSGNRYYAPHIKTLIQTYNDLQMPIKSLEYSKKLVLFQRCNNANYELLANSYIQAAKYYQRVNDVATAKKLLRECIAIKEKLYLLESSKVISYNMMSKVMESGYNSSENLNSYFQEASEILKEIN